MDGNVDAEVELTLTICSVLLRPRSGLTVDPYCQHVMSTDAILTKCKVQVRKLENLSCWMPHHEGCFIGGSDRESIEIATFERSFAGDRRFEVDRL